MLGSGAEMDYHPKLFAAYGLCILVFCYASFWYWAASHRHLDERLKKGHAFRAVSYLYFLLTSMEDCALLGNPFSGRFYYARTEINPKIVAFSVGRRLACGRLFGLRVLLSVPLGLFNLSGNGKHEGEECLIRIQVMY